MLERIKSSVQLTPGPSSHPKDQKVCQALGELMHKDLVRLEAFFLGLKDGDTVGLACHPLPDPDAAACLLGMDFLLRQKGFLPVMAVPNHTKDEVVRLGFLDIRKISASGEELPCALILLDTHDWKRAGLKVAPDLIWDNHKDLSTKNSFLSTEVAAVSSVVAAAIIADSFTHALLDTPLGEKLAAQLMLGIATDCRYLPGLNPPLELLTAKLPGMREGDWLAFQALKEHADLDVLREIQASAVWSSAILVLKEASGRAQAILPNLPEIMFAHMGNLSEETDRLRALVSDALTLGQEGRGPAEVAVVTSVNDSQLKISLRLSEGPEVLIKLGSQFGERFFAAVYESARKLGFGAPSYGVRNGTVGGGYLPLSIFGNDPIRAQEFVTNELRKFVISTF